MKILKTIIFIILVLLPMIIFLNPFFWGGRGLREYTPSEKTNSLMWELNEKYNTDIHIYGAQHDTIWYFRDIDNGKIVKRANLKLKLNINKDQIIDKNRLKSYVMDFKSKFEHRSQ